MSKKLTYADRKRRPETLLRGDEQLHAGGITYMEADLKLNHLRVLMAIVSNLQRALRFRINRGNERKGIPEVFLPEKNSQGLRVLTIPFETFHFGKKNGARLRQCLNELCSMSIRFPENGSFNAFPGLIAGFSFPAYSHTVDILLSDAMLFRLLLIEEGYTSYSLSDALSISNKYTVRIYWLLCSWRNKGGFVLGVNDFRRMMCLGHSYNRIDNIVTHILRPSAKELRTHCHIWFVFRIVERSERKFICFKIGYNIDEASRNRIIRESWEFCRSLMDAAGGHVQILSDIWAQVDFEDLQSFVDKLSSVTAEIRIRRNIGNVDAYIHAAMSVWLSDWLLRYANIGDR